MRGDLASVWADIVRRGGVGSGLEPTKEQLGEPTQPGCWTNEAMARGLDRVLYAHGKVIRRCSGHPQIDARALGRNCAPDVSLSVQLMVNGLGSIATPGADNRRPDLRITDDGALVEAVSTLETPPQSAASGRLR